MRRNAKANRSKGVDLWYHTCGVAIKIYLTFLLGGIGKMVASIRIAAVMYNNPDDRDSFKAQSIRSWGGAISTLWEGKLICNIIKI